jgi:hypothetical protein
MAQIVLYRDGIIAHRETRPFDRRPAAAAWIKKQETELAKPDALLGVSQRKKSPPLLGLAMGRYHRVRQENALFKKFMNSRPQ